MAGRFLILGAGPTGIGAALRLMERGHSDFLILEASDHAGGLASSVVDEQGFTWDIGGHVQFSHYEEFDRAMESALGADGWLFHERRSYVWIAGRFVPYPFQNNLRHLDPPARDRCVAGLEEAARRQAAARPKNFREWISATFGEGIAEVFLYPYNWKVWAYPPETMDFKWIGERVAVPDVSRVKENIRLGRDDAGWGPNDTFRFPKHGGTGSTWRALVKKIPAGKIRFLEEVTAVDLSKREALTAKGAREPYDRLISSLPIDRFCRLTGDAALARLGRKMVYSSTHIVGVGLRGSPPEHLKDKCWMYFPESDSPFYRVTVFSNYSPNNVPDIREYWSLMTETSESNHKPVDMEAIVDETIRGLQNTRLLPDRRSIVSTWHKRVDHGYPTPFLGRDQTLTAIHQVLEPLGVSSRGRFGGWRYEVSNQDHSFMQGREAVDHLLTGSEEMTYHHPDVVNRGGKRR